MLEEDLFSITSSEEDDDPMKAFLDRCSICFDSQYDMCLRECKDQFCIECFEKYVTHVVKSSWGLSVTKIKCPVCNDNIDREEWGHYVPKNIVDLYDKQNKPYRSYTRTCPHCDIEIIPCKHYSIYQQPSSICAFLNTVISSCTKQEKHSDNSDHLAIYGWIKQFQQQKDIKPAKIYKTLIKDIFQFEKNHISQYSTIQHHYSYQLSILFLKLSIDPDTWKQLQFMHITFFPNMSCLNCYSSICLHCGYDSHPNLSCFDNMNRMAHTLCISNEIKFTILWKLENSRQCPNCSIMINRDEGCNKVDCSYCGFTFCWSCLSSWSEDCGFYTCSTTTPSQDLSISLQTEVGIPDIKTIQARVQPNRQASITL